MKLLVTMSILAATLQFAPVAFGHDGKGPRGIWRERMEARLANLSPDERAKLRAARLKAKEDPAVQAARDKMRQVRKELRDAMHASMLKADPTIQPILDKIPARHSRDS